MEPQQAASGNEKRLVEALIALGAGIKVDHQAHILVMPLRRLICIGRLLKVIRLLH
jgi:hypothetical protein